MESDVCRPGAAVMPGVNEKPDPGVMKVDDPGAASCFRAALK